MLSLHILLLFDAIIIVKFFFIFLLKNPTVIQDDFWKLFANLWIVLFNLVTQSNFNLMPGREQVPVGIFYGKVSAGHVTGHPKRMYMALVVAGFTLSFWLSKPLFKKCNRKRFIEYQNYEVKWSNVVVRDNIHSYALHVLGLTYILIDSSIYARLNNIHAALIEKCPNYILVCIQHNIMPPFAIVFLICIFLVKNSKLQRDVRSELREFIPLRAEQVSKAILLSK